MTILNIFKTNLKSTLYIRDQYETLAYKQPYINLFFLFHVRFQELHDWNYLIFIHFIISINYCLVTWLTLVGTRIWEVDTPGHFVSAHRIIPRTLTCEFFFLVIKLFNKNKFSINFFKDDKK